MPRTLTGIGLPPVRCPCRHNGSLVFGEDLRVTFVGRPALSISSIHGSIEVYTRFILDGYVDSGSPDGTLGGYGGKKNEHSHKVI